jgi:hypothetical protein
MKTVLLLEREDTILATDWARPLHFIPRSEHSDYTDIESLGVYCGLPSNNVRWVKAGDALGKHWIGRRLGELNDGIDKLRVGTNYRAKYEVVRGDMPQASVWDWKKDRDRQRSMCGANAQGEAQPPEKGL